MLLFKVGAFVALLLLLHYTWRTDGWRSTGTLVFYLTGMSVFREWVVAHLNASNQLPPPYAANPTLGQAGSVNVVVVAGWVFSSILSFALAKIVQRRNFPGTNIFLTLALTALATTTISYVVELTGMRIHLWDWRESHPVSWLPFDWPFDAFEGWASTTFLFMLIYCSIRYRLFSSRLWVSAAVPVGLMVLSLLAELTQPWLGPDSPRKKVMVVYFAAAVVLGFRAPDKWLGSSTEALRGP